MFDNLGGGEILVLLILALFIFGPQRLPHMAAEAARTLRQLRRMMLKARRDMQEGLGPEYQDLDITDLHPRTFMRKHLFDDLDDDGLDERGSNSGRAPTSAVGRGERPPYDREAT